MLKIARGEVHFFIVLILKMNFKFEQNLSRSPLNVFQELYWTAQKWARQRFCCFLNEVQSTNLTRNDLTMKLDVKLSVNTDL